MKVYDRAKAARHEHQIYFHPKDLHLPQQERRVIIRDGMSWARCLVMPFKSLEVLKSEIEIIQMDEDEVPE